MNKVTHLMVWLIMPMREAKGISLAVKKIDILDTYYVPCTLLDVTDITPTIPFHG